MKKYLVVCKDNFDIVGEYHSKKEALKNRLFGCVVYTRKQYENAKAKKIEDSKAICLHCGKVFFPASSFLEDAICDYCKYTNKEKSNINF